MKSKNNTQHSVSVFHNVHSSLCVHLTVNKNNNINNNYG